MKKFLASLLAVSMVASMSAVSFAADKVHDASTVVKMTGTHDKVSPEAAFITMVKKKGTKYYYDKENGYPVANVLIGPFGYDSEDKNLTTDNTIEFGKTAYYLLTALSFTDKDDASKYTSETRSDATSEDDFRDMIDNGDIAPQLITDSDSTSNLKVKEDLEEGKDILKGITITKKKVSDVGYYKHEVGSETEDEFHSQISGAPDQIDGLKSLLDEYGFEKDTYYYMVALTIEDSSSVSDADLIGTLTLTKSKKPKADDIDFDFAVNVDWENSYRNNSEVIVKEDFETVLAEKYYAMKFDCDEEIEITFEDDSTFTVDVSGQPKTLLYYDTDFNSKVAAKFPLAELNFWNGNGAKFNRTGEFFLRVGDDAEDFAQFLYQVNADGTLSEVPGAEYDDSDGGFYFKTRTLGTYVFSDMELETSKSSGSNDKDDTTVVTPDPVAPVTPVAPINPGTGARA